MKQFFLLFYLAGMFATGIQAQGYNWTTYYAPATSFVDGGSSLWMQSGNTLIQFDKSARCFNRINIPDSVQISNDHQNQYRYTVRMGVGYPFIDSTSYDGQNWGTVPYALFLASYTLHIGGTDYYNWINDSAGNYYFFYDSLISVYNGSTLTNYDTVNTMMVGNLYFQNDFFNASQKAFDNSGNLWISLASAGILKFNGQNFTLYDSTSLGDVSNFYCTGIYANPWNNDIYFSDPVDSFPHFYVYNGSTWRSDSIPFATDNQGITSMFFAANVVYFCTRSGIFSYDGTSYARVTLPAPFDNNAAFYSVQVSADRGGNYWIMANNLLMLFDGRQFTAFPDPQAKLASNYILNQLIDNNGKQWLGYDYSIGMIDNSGIHNYPSLGGTLGTMLIDSLGRLWHGNEYDAFYFDTIDHPVSVTGGILNFALDKNKNIWAVNMNGVLQYSGQLFVPFAVPLIDSVYSEWVTGMVIDTNNIKWISAGSPTAGIYTGTAGGLIRYDGTTCTRFDLSNSPIPNDIECMTVDAQNRLWVGTSNNGIMIYDGSTWTVYNTSNSGIPGNKIESFYFRNGLSYITTQDNGATIFDGTNWTSFTRQNSPLDNDCESILMDSSCQLWIGQECGLAMMTGLCGPAAGTRYLHGAVYRPDGSPSAHELVYLMQYDSAANVMRTVESTFTDGNGDYHFLTDLSEVYIHALPHTSDTTGGIMPVYEDTSIVQQGATRILMDSSVVTRNIWSVQAVRLSGPTILTGSVSAPQGRSVQGLRLFLMSGGQPVATTVTAMDGTFSFHGLSPGVYKIWVDKMGVDNTLAPSVDFLTVNSANAVCQLTPNQLRILSVGVNEVSGNSVKVFPNPSHGIINIAVQGTENVDVSLTDMMGKEMVHTSVVPGTQRIDLSGLEAGVYILRLQSGTEVYTQRQVISK